jgi:hypothetical protein
MASLDEYKKLLEEEVARRNAVQKGELLNNLIKYYQQDAEGRAFFRTQTPLNKYQMAGQELLQQMFTPYGVSDVAKYIEIAKEFNQQEAEKKLEEEARPSLLQSLLQNLIGE